jgi:hypothetical protein
LGSPGSAAAPVAVLSTPGSATTPKKALGVPTLQASAILLVAPSGADNNFLLTSRLPGTEGNNIFFEMTLSSGFQSVVSVTGNNTSGFYVVVALKTKAMMLISGTTPACEPRVLFTSDNSAISGLGLWYDSEEQTQTSLYTVSGVWHLLHYDEDGYTVLYHATKTSANTTPDGLTGWTVLTGSGQPTITAATTCARQVVDLINADDAANNLVMAELVGRGFSSCVEMSTTSMGGGRDWPVIASPSAVLGSPGSAAAPQAVLASAGSATTPAAVLGSAGSATTPAAVLASPGSAAAPLNVM